MSVWVGVGKGVQKSTNHPSHHEPMSFQQFGFRKTTKALRELQSGLMLSGFTGLSRFSIPNVTFSRSDLKKGKTKNDITKQG